MDNQIRIITCYASERFISIMHQTEKTENELELQTYPTPPMSNRWWIFLTCLWTTILIAAAPVFLLPAIERPYSVVNLSQTSITSVTVLQKKPILDWTGRLSQYELQVITHGLTRRFTWPGTRWQITSKADGGVQISSGDGQIVIPLTDSNR